MSKTTVSTILVAVISFTLGAWLFHTKAVAAQTKPRVIRVVPLIFDPPLPSVTLKGTVVGFSCAQPLQGYPQCYAALIE